MDFIILSINGRDVSNSSHEEAVRYFEAAQEPITIQVLRKESVRSSVTGCKVEKAPLEQGESKKSTSVQTDLAGLINDEYVENYYVFEDGEEYDFDNEPEDGDEGEEFEEIFSNSVVGPHQIRDYKMREDIYFEEVTLKKSTSNEKLGLTVCYNYAPERDTNNSETAEVYISEICKDSLAARDGRLREGDQILQVNGKDIESKEQTEKVFAQTKNTVVILVSRCDYHQASSSPTFIEDVPAYQNSMIELLLQQQKRQYGNSHNNPDGVCRGPSSVCKSPPPPVPSHNNSSNCCNINTSSSSGSSQNSPESNKDCIVEKTTNCGDIFLKDSIKRIDDLCISGKRNKKLIEPPASDSEHIYETIPESETEPIYSSPYESKLNIRRNETVVSHDHRSKSSKSSSSIEEKDSSSAYNTGESCHSNPLVLELHKDPRELRSSTLVLCPSDQNTTVVSPPNSCRNRQQPPPSCDVAENQVIRTIQSSLSAPQFINHHQLTPDKEDKKFNSSYYQTSQYQHHQYQSPYQYYQQPYHSQNISNNRGCWDNRDKDSTGSGGIMYTNVDNLEQTMMLQQKIFTQALNRKNFTNKESKIKNSKSRGKFRAPNLTQYHFIGSQQVRQSNTMDMQQQEEKCDPRLEWKVKRRPDGTRYIVRRQTKSKLLGNRTLEISEERAGLTTEDDTVSEIKLGRYWTKDERKRHLEQARQRKQRQAIMKHQQIKSLQYHEVANCETVTQGEDNKEARKSTQDMALININKMDELHCGASGKPIVGLLSVTTV